MLRAGLVLTVIVLTYASLKEWLRTSKTEQMVR